MKICKIDPCDLVNGSGVRVSVWVSGCGHKCPGCHNVRTWDPNTGNDITPEMRQFLFDSLTPGHIDGVTWTGGDPLYPANREEITKLATEVRERFPNKTQWLYTGYLWEDIKDLPIIQYLDYIVDGPYVESERDISHGYTGSRNQRVINIKASLNENKIILFDFNEKI